MIFYILFICVLRMEITNLLQTHQILQVFQDAFHGEKMSLFFLLGFLQIYSCFFWKQHQIPVLSFSLVFPVFLQLGNLYYFFLKCSTYFYFSFCSVLSEGLTQSKKPSENRYARTWELEKPRNNTQSFSFYFAALDMLLKFSKSWFS